jgi:5-methylcytosine-specific restriction protein A
MAEIAWGPFLERRAYNRRRDIHVVYGGQQQGGICTPSDHPVIFLFTGEAGGQHGYGDG